MSALFRVKMQLAVAFNMENQHGAPFTQSIGGQAEVDLMILN